MRLTYVVAIEVAEKFYAATPGRAKLTREEVRDKVADQIDTALFTSETSRDGVWEGFKVLGSTSVAPSRLAKSRRGGFR